MTPENMNSRSRDLTPCLAQPWSRRAKSPEVTEGGGARRGSEARSVGPGSRSRPHPAEPRAGGPQAQVPRCARSDVSSHDEIQQAVRNEDGPGQLLALEPGTDAVVVAGQRQGLRLRRAPFDVQAAAHLAVDLHDERDARGRRELRVEVRPRRFEEGSLFPEPLPPLFCEVRRDGMEKLEKRP